MRCSKMNPWFRRRILILVLAGAAFAVSDPNGTGSRAAGNRTSECMMGCNQGYSICENDCDQGLDVCLSGCGSGKSAKNCRQACKAVKKACHFGCVGGKKQCKSACPKGKESPTVPLARLIHEPPTATADLAVPPGVLGPRTLRRTV